MTEGENDNILLFLLRQQRLQSEFLVSLADSLHAVRESITALNKKLATQIDSLESEERGAKSLPDRMALRKIDDIIRKLESRRQPRVN